MTEYEEITNGKSILELEKELRFQYSLGYTETDSFPQHIKSEINKLNNQVNKLDSIIASKTTLLYSFANIMEGYIADIKSAMIARDILISNDTKKKIYAFDIKKAVDAIHKNTVDFRNDLNKHYKDNETFKLEFGANTDLLEDTIKEVIKEKVGFSK